jgi:hypothetical protein
MTLPFVMTPWLTVGVVGAAPAPSVQPLQAAMVSANVEQVTARPKVFMWGFLLRP